MSLDAGFQRCASLVAPLLLLLNTGLIARADDPSAPLFAYVGTYTAPLRDVMSTQVDLPPGNGRGIHIFRVDRATGGMSPAGIYEMGTSPSCVALNRSGTRLYSANETERVGTEKSGTVSSFDVDRTDGKLKLLNTVASGGAGPTYVAFHPSGRYLFVANYFSGSVAVLPIVEDGRLGPATDIKTDAGRIGPTHATNAPPGSFAFSGHDRTHAHQIGADPSGKFVLHVDLGLDKIFVWKFDARNGVLSPGNTPVVSLPPGDGPRHFHFHPNGRWLYSLQEEGSTLVLFDYDGATGRLTARSDHFQPAPGFCRQQFLLGNPRIDRRPLRLRRQPAARQHRHFRDRTRRVPQIHRRGVVARQLSAKL